MKKSVEMISVWSLALAFALTASAKTTQTVVSDWFAESSDNFTTASWAATSPDTVGVVGEKIVVDTSLTGAGAAFTTPSQSATVDYSITETKVAFAAASTSLPELTSADKAGITVVAKGEGYIFKVVGKDGDSLAWVDTSAAAELDTEYTIKVDVGTDDKVTYYVKSGDAEYSKIAEYATSAKSTAEIAAYGYGEFAFLNGAYAYSVAVTEYTVSFDLNGGEGSAPAAQTIEAGGTATKPATDPTRAGYTFSGWTTNATVITAWDFATVVTSDMTLYAQWRVNTIPGGTNTVTAATADEAKAKVSFSAPSAVVSKGVDVEAYEQLFVAQATPVSGSDNEWNVTYVLTEAAKDAEEEKTEAKTEALPIASATSAQSVNLSGLTPGLYYGIEKATGLSGTTPDWLMGTMQMADADGNITGLEMAAGSATAGFYRVVSSTTDLTPEK